DHPQLPRLPTWIHHASEPHHQGANQGDRPPARRRGHLLERVRTRRRAGAHDGDEELDGRHLRVLLMARVTRYHGLLLPDEGQPTDYRTQAAREPEPVLEPALRRGPPAPPTWKQIGIFLLVLPLVIAFMASMLSEGQGGTLVCNRASNRCDLDNGWLIHDREQFPPD